MTTIAVKCPRCNGKGIIKTYSHVLGGVCFRCRLNKDALVAPGDFDAPVEVGNGFLRVDRQMFKLSHYAEMTRKEVISLAADLFNQMDAEGMPRGFMIAELLVLAKVSGADLQDRIVAALLRRARRHEVAEIQEVGALLGVLAPETRCTAEA